ncbi:MAG TPA: hypothetical protein VLI94_00490 [Solirubrobacterales bacterium]|nr:hypothetical protein [Solirubrobacterales bacterium]
MPLFGRDRRGIETDQKRALAHPVRLHIWFLFTRDTDRPLTAAALHADLAKERKFGAVTVSQVNYHVARLKDAQLLPTG